MDLARDDLSAVAAAAADLKQGAAHRHVWIAAGHGMLAMRMSVDTGQLMADLINGPRAGDRSRPLPS